MITVHRAVYSLIIIFAISMLLHFQKRRADLHGT